MKNFILFALILAPCVGFSDNIKNVDIKDFEENADICIHLSGEWDVDLPEENKKEIKENMNDACGRAKSLYPILEQKYKKNANVRRLLKKYKELKNYEYWE